MYKLLTVLLLLCLSPAGCAHLPSPLERSVTADKLAERSGWKHELVFTDNFTLQAYLPKAHDNTDTLTLYIEGDGLAWISKKTISTDPTPVNPVGLKLALHHPKGNAVYLARPCQYIGGVTARGCNKHYWTDGRFSEEVIASMNDAVNILKAEFKATELQLIGFSGGGAIAALLAARRNDVIRLITVAGNLDHRAWTTYHKISPLTGSLNPADYRQQLTRIEQIHFAGNDDKVMPAFLARDFIAGLSNSANSKVIVVPNQTHSCCWETIWAILIPPQKTGD